MLIGTTKWFRSPKGNWFRPANPAVQHDPAITAFYSRKDSGWKLVIDNKFGNSVYESERGAAEYAESVVPKIIALKRGSDIGGNPIV